MRKRLIESDTIEVTNGCSVIMASMIAIKRKIIILCTIRTHKFEKALYDLGASTNLTPFAIYKRIVLVTPTPISIRVLMAYRSIKKLIGIVIDVLVKRDRFILPVDFVVLIMKWTKRCVSSLVDLFLPQGEPLLI